VKRRKDENEVQQHHILVKFSDVTFKQEEKTMKRNIQVVVNKVNVVVVIVVVILVVLVTVVSGIRVIGLENISTGVVIENMITATPETSDVLEIAGVVVVDPNSNGGPVRVQPNVVTPVRSNISIGHIHGSRYLGEAFMGSDIAQRAQINDGIDINDGIAIATIKRITISDLSAGISDGDTSDAGLIAGIEAAPISGNYIGDGEIMDIAAAKIITRSGNIENIS
jgi:hypothetical protein